MENKPEAQASTPATGTREQIALTCARGGILGIKAGMTQVFTEDGSSVAVTVIDLSPSVITQVRTKEKDGYLAVQVGFQVRDESGTGTCEEIRFHRFLSLSGIPF